MKQRRRIYYSAAQRAEIWDRWQAGESMSSIGRRFDRESSSVFSVLSPTGGIRPPDRQAGGSGAQSWRARGDIARAQHPTARCVRSPGRWVGRRPRSAARFCATAGRNGIGRHAPIRRPGIGPCAPSAASWLADRLWPGQYRPSCSGTGRPSRSPAGSSAPGPGSRTIRCRTKPSIAACSSRPEGC